MITIVLCLESLVLSSFRPVKKITYHRYLSFHCILLRRDKNAAI